MPVRAVERKLTAILAADVAGYSRLMGADEVGTLQRFTACRAIVDGLIAYRRRDRSERQFAGRRRQHRRAPRALARARRHLRPGAVHDQIGTKVPVSFVELADPQMKNIAQWVGVDNGKRYLIGIIEVAGQTYNEVVAVKGGVVSQIRTWM